jgi:predicted dinucleotide-binding enzyme
MHLSPNNPICHRWRSVRPDDGRKETVPRCALDERKLGLELIQLFHDKGKNEALVQMTLGTLGAGQVAQAFAIHLLKAGHEVLLSNSRGPDSLKQLVSKLGKGARAVTMEEAARAPIVVLAVPWPQVEEVLAKLPEWEGRILIDATNHFLLPSMELADLKGRVSSEIVSELDPSARVVKALNTLYASNLTLDPKVENGRRVIFVSGDDGDAKAEISGLLKGLGVAVIALGSLSEGGRAQQVGNGLAGVDLVQFGD